MELIEAPDYAKKDPIEQKKMLRDATAGRETRLLYIKKERKDQLDLADDSFSPDFESENNGVGAALADKNIMAVACRGTLDIEVKDPEAVITYEKNHHTRSSDKKTPWRDPEGSVISGPAGKAELTEIEKTVAQCLGLPFEKNGVNAASGLGILSARIQLNTGMDLNENDLKNIAYRCITLERLFNIRAGIAEKNGCTAENYRKYGWTRKTVMKKRKVFDALQIGDLRAQLKA
jgi:aldehyde:ferredoxin oxidoreductase